MKIKKLLLGLLLSAGVLSTSSCSFLFGQQGYLIDHVEQIENSDGSVTVVFYYTDEDIEPLYFTIDAGVAGKDGVGIKNITYTDIYTNPDDGKDYITITIEYSDDTIEDTNITVPVLKGDDGKDGVSVTGVSVSSDEEGNTVIEFSYSDGTSSDPITILKGKDGVGIAYIEASEPDRFGDITVTIYYTDENKAPYSFIIHNGIDGKQIESISYSEDDSSTTEYALLVIYNDGSSELVYIPRPHATVWHSGSIAPVANLGVDGDFYLNELTGDVYKKMNGIWVFLFSMKGTGNEVQYRLTFKVNGGEWEWTSAGMNSSDDRTLVVEGGKYLDFTKYAMTIDVVRTGYEFVGWYTTPDYKLNPTSGKFTDLTIIQSDLTLYANWELIA